MKNVIKYLSPVASIIILGLIFLFLADRINWLALFLLIACTGIFVVILGARYKYISLAIAGVLIFFLSGTAWSINDYQTNVDQPINLANYSVDLTSININKDETTVYLPSKFLGYEYNYSAIALVTNLQKLDDSTYYAVCDLGSYPTTQVNWLYSSVKSALDRRLEACKDIWQSPNLSGRILNNQEEAEIATFLEVTNGDAPQEFFQNFTMFFNYLYYSLLIVIVSTVIELLTSLIRRRRA